MVSHEILEDTTVFSCEESFLYSERWFFSLPRTKHIYPVATFVRTLTIRNVDYPNKRIRIQFVCSGLCNVESCFAYLLLETLLEILWHSPCNGTMKKSLQGKNKDKNGLACTDYAHTIDRAPAMTFCADKSSRIESILFETFVAIDFSRPRIVCQFRDLEIDGRGLLRCSGVRFQRCFLSTHARYFHD